MQWKEENRALFAACLNGLEDEPMVRAMDAIPQHVKGVSCYDHCLFVAYVGFTLCRIFGLDYRAAARAGLLHDLYLQKWEETDVGRFRRLVIHPQLALENARAFGLSPMEEDIIGKKMSTVRTASYTRADRTAIGHEIKVRYIASITI